MGLRQQGSQAVVPGSSLCRAESFHNFIDICSEFHSNAPYGTHRKALLRYFSVLWDKISDWKSWCPDIRRKIFRNPKPSGTFKVSPRQFLTLWDWKVSTENRDICLFCMKFFDNPSFSKNWKFTHENFRHLGTKEFRQNRDSRIIRKHFRHQNISETQGSPLRIFLLLRQKKSPEFVTTTPS